MLHRRADSGMRKVSPPQPTFMTSDQKASYLSNLRNNRPVRPIGSRPLPGKPQSNIGEHDLLPRAESAASLRNRYENLVQEETDKQPTLSKRASMPLSISQASVNGSKGRPLVQPPGTIQPGSRKVSPTYNAGPAIKYKESASRLSERVESRAIREALARIDQRDEEQELYDAAKAEAAELVWKHRNPQLAEAEKVAPYRNPDLAKKRYGDLTHERKQTAPSEMPKQPRTTSGTSTSSQDSHKSRLPWLRRRSRSSITGLSKEPIQPTSTGRIADEEGVTALPQLRDQGRRRSSGKRNFSSGSSKGIFRNPEDQIYEEPEAAKMQHPPPKQELPLRTRDRNSQPRGSRPLPSQPASKVDRYEIWKNPPTQSRRADYTSNSSRREEVAEEVDEQPETPKASAIEVRSEDIRAATSMKKKDRSPNLPTPTAVSDRAGRPIVSFDPKWQSSHESPRNSQHVVRPNIPVSSAAIPSITIMEDKSKSSRKGKSGASVTFQDTPSITVTSTNPIPSICFPDDEDNNATEDKQNAPIPTLNVSGPVESSKVPDIHVQGKPASRPLPSPGQSTGKKVATRIPPNSSRGAKVPWLSRGPAPATSGATVSCNACDLPISGRIVTAAGASQNAAKARFHPECFSCHHCSTPLECVSFYPEPESARLERFQTAMPHVSGDDEHVVSLARSNEDLRFFCHLDFHELYSPRCHTCKTPVEGQVVLALGRHYHPDHFFCAECGDPFTSDSPFVEHNSYAYCVSCHTKRTSARCRACKKQILDEMTIEALGGKWHDACFVCDECGGDFGDEGKFFVREVAVELTEKERRKGFGRKTEERAVCQACEEHRVKNVDMFL